MKRLFILFLFMLTALGCTDDDTPANNGNNGTDQGNNGTGDMDPDVLTLLGISPDSGNVSGNTSISLTGSGFVSGMRVTIGDNPATDVVVLSPSSASAVTPAGELGEADVTVINPDESRSTLSNTFRYIEANDPLIGFCQLQAQSPATGVVGEATAPLYALVFSEGITNGAGQGAYIIGELGWGLGADVDQYSFTSMTYNEDKDGLNPGDLSNDEYGASLTIPSAAEYRYVARFRTEQRAEWVYCDLDGSENGISEDQLGVLIVSEATQPEVGFCQLQAQSPLSSTSGEFSPDIYALVFVDGVTSNAGQGSGVEGELGWGNAGADADTFAFYPLTYDSDQDGINAGDIANDQYSGRLQVSSAGDQRYAARFRVNAGDWTYCDLDGIGTGNLGVLTVTDPVQPSVGFCQTETRIESAITNQPSGEITSSVFIAGVTQGAGQGANVSAELVWGPRAADPNTWTNTLTPTFKEDADGLVPGDLANDRYVATITASQQGEYDYAYRFSADGGTTWNWCDTDGSTPFDAAKVGTLSVTDVLVNTPDHCNLQFPQIHTKVLVGESITVYGRVVESGVTGGGVAVTELSGELLVGPHNTDPAANPGAFTTYSATVRPSGDVINPGVDEDEYEASFTATTAGDFALIYRFSVDGGSNWQYCDIDGKGANSSFELDRVGAAQVFDAASNPNLLDYCNIWQANLSATTAATSPLLTIETYEPGITDAGGASSDLEAEVGYGLFGANPAISGVFTWNPTPLPYKGPRVGTPNNWEYEGEIYPSTAKPTLGVYSVAVRARLTGTTSWVYCDTNNATMNYSTSDASTLSIVAP